MDKKKKFGRSVIREEEEIISHATRWLPLFIVVLLVLLIIVYLQSTRVTVPEASPGGSEMLPTSDQLGRQIEKSAESILDMFPTMRFTASSLSAAEESELIKLSMPQAKTAVPKITDEALARIMEKNKEKYRRAIELVNPAGYINTESISIEDLVGDKVIAVVFWTSSSQNSLRQAEFLKMWYSAYKDLGLEIIAVHTPEFRFEKDHAVVQAAVDKIGMNYPVVLDDEFFIWRAYGNKFWPTVYLIDVDGFIRYEKVGDANCEDVDKNIKILLQERKEALKLDITIPQEHIMPDIEAHQMANIKTPRVYLGYAKNRGDLGNPEGFMANMPVKYSLPGTLIHNSVYLEGEWLNNDDHMVLESDSGTVTIDYNARDVYMVAGGNAQVQVIIDGKEVAGLQTMEPKLYLVHKGESHGPHRVELIITGKGFDLYSVSFG